MAEFSDNLNSSCDRRKNNITNTIQFFHIYVKFVCTCNRQQCTTDIQIMKQNSAKTDQQHQAKTHQNTDFAIFAL